MKLKGLLRFGCVFFAIITITNISYSQGGGTGIKPVQDEDDGGGHKQLSVICDYHSFNLVLIANNHSRICVYYQNVFFDLKRFNLS